MLRKTWNRYRGLSNEIRSMISIYWIYELIQVTLAVFIEIFVFLQTQSLGFLIFYNVIYFTGIFLGFSVWGYLLAELRISMKLNYLRAFLIYFLSFLILIFSSKTDLFLVLFGLLNGLAIGAFWITVHFYELTLTENATRDFYSSMLSLGAQSFAVISPFVATITFFISKKVLHLETYTLLFILLPFFTLLSLPFLFKLPDLIPEKITNLSLKRLFFDKVLSKARIYYLAQGFTWGSIVAIMPVIAISAMKTVINIGVLQTILGLISIFIIMFLSHVRHEGNRIKIMFHAGILFTIGCGFLFFWNISPWFYVIYLLMDGLGVHIWRVSEHTIDLQSIEMIKEENCSFYAGLIYRDVVLWIGRMAGILITGTIYFLLQNEVLTIKIVIVITTIGLWWIYFAAKRMLKWKRS